MILNVTHYQIVNPDYKRKIVGAIEWEECMQKGPINVVFTYFFQNC